MKYTHTYIVSRDSRAPSKIRTRIASRLTVKTTTKVKTPLFSCLFLSFIFLIKSKLVKIAQNEKKGKKKPNAIEF